MIVRGLSHCLFSEATVLTLGTFDGVHRGHQALLREAERIATAQGMRPVALTFPEPPQNHFNGTPRKKLILPTAKKLELLEAFGIDTVAVVEFQEIAGLSAREFAQQILKEQFSVSHVVVGYDCRFGKGRGGDAESLRTFGRDFGFGVSVIEPVVVNGVIVSSTEVRRMIQTGEVKSAARLLGYAPILSGRLIERQTREGWFGPTAVNLDLDGDIATPDEGVFLVDVGVSGRGRPGVMRVRPSDSFGDGRVLKIQLSPSDLMTLTGTAVEVKLLTKVEVQSTLQFSHVSKTPRGVHVKAMNNLAEKVGAGRGSMKPMVRRNQPYAQAHHEQ